MRTKGIEQPHAPTRRQRSNTHVIYTVPAAARVRHLRTVRPTDSSFRRAHSCRPSIFRRRSRSVDKLVRDYVR